METFAGFTEHTDVEIGRLVDAIDQIGELDNTLFIYVMGDNGASGEGGLEGTFNELVHLNGIFDAETIDSMLARSDDQVGPIPSRIFRLPGQLLLMLPLSGQSKWLPILAEPGTVWLLACRI